jgi:phage terminase small subunit
MDKRDDKLEITADRVLKEIARLAFMDPLKFFKDDGSLKRIQDLDDDTAVSLAGMEVTELFEGSGDQKHAYGLLKKIKIADKGQNLERLGRHLKLFSDKTEHSCDISSLQPNPRLPEAEEGEVVVIHR